VCLGGEVKKKPMLKRAKAVKVAWGPALCDAWGDADLLQATDEAPDGEGDGAEADGGEEEAIEGCLGAWDW
jgi:hypothetical protein